MAHQILIMIIFLIFAQLADLMTALNMAAYKTEINPVMIGVVNNPLAAVSIKTALLVYLVALVVVIKERKRLANSIVALGTVFGIVGAISNL